MLTTFVILHYLTEKDTNECIDSILKSQKQRNFNIIVVDNASPNGSGQRLKERWQNQENINVILSRKNLGFAKGNNLGFLKAKKEYKSDFIVLLNNDTIIEQNNFTEIIEKKFLEKDYAVLGPDIISLMDRGHQNPAVMPIRKTRLDVLTRIANISFFYFLEIIGVRKYLRRIKRIIFKKEASVIETVSKKTPEEVENIKLHGSCLIFSRNYINKMDGLFSKTFMYGEEDILYYLCNRKGLKLLYSPELYIYHKESSSTEEEFSSTSNRKKTLFVHKNAIISLWHLYCLMHKKNL